MFDKLIKTLSFFVFVNRRQELNLMEKLIREMLTESQNKVDSDSALVKIKSEMLSIKNDMSGSEQRNSDLQHDVRILEKVCASKFYPQSLAVLALRVSDFHTTKYYYFYYQYSSTIFI